MFHAAGWTFPWSITFSFATQVSKLLLGFKESTDFFTDMPTYCLKP